MKKRSAQSWRETPQDILAIVAGYKEGKDSPEFKAYCDVHSVEVRQQEYERQLCAALRCSKRKLLALPRSKKIYEAMARSAEAAVDRAPKYFNDVRRILHSYFHEWFAYQKNTRFLMVEHRPDLGRRMERLLKSSRPFVRWNVGQPSEIQNPNIASFAGGTAETEAARLFFRVVTWPDANVLDHVRSCKECKEGYFAIRSDKEFCTTACRKKFHSHSPEFKANRAEYMRKRYQKEKQGVVDSRGRKNKHVT